MDAQHGHKTFLKAYQALNDSYEAFNIYLSDKRLTQIEKKLLQALKLLVKDQAIKSRDLLLEISPQNDFLDAYKSFFLGLVYNHMSLFDKAVKELNQAVDIFDRIEYNEHIYRPMSVLAKVYYDQRKLKKLKESHLHFKSLKVDSNAHHILDYEFQIFISNLEGNTKEALQLTDKLTKKYSDELKRSLATYSILKYQMLFQLNDFDKCFEELTKYRALNGYKMKANYFFMLSLLNYYTKDASIYVYQRDFKDSEYLFCQLKVIQQVDKKNIKQAKEYWQKLSSLEPDLYGKFLEYKAQHDPFSFCINKAKNSVDTSSSNQLQIDHQHFEEIKSSRDRLEYILETQDFYLDKGDLIKLIWNEEWTPTNEKRLRTLISRLRAKKKVTIDLKDGKYKKVA